MLKLTTKEIEIYDDEHNEFSYLKPTELTLEHSLVSISKWESKWHKAFFGNEQKTEEEVVDYIKCMTITQNVNDMVFRYMDQESINKIRDYMNDSMTATTFNDNTLKSSRRQDVLTAEVIYYLMISYNIPFECQKWHINKLFTLIRVCQIKNDGGKKMNKRSIQEQNRQLNEMRRKALNSKG